MRKGITILILAAFLTNTFVPYAHAQQALNLPAAGMRMELSQGFSPALLKGVKVYPHDPFRLDFILDRGDSTTAKDDADRLIKYFLAALTVPEKDLWVNLSPYEKDRIVPEAFGQTEMGRDLLAQDYILKQITASLMYPEGDVGKEFWAKIYAQAQEKFGTTDIPVDTFNKVWIVPEKATVYENKDAAFVVGSRLKVMLESDYLAMDHNIGGRPEAAPAQELTQDILRSVIIPILEKEVNEGKNFSSLRQVYYALILATWFKDKIKQTILGQAYVDQKKTAGVDIEDKSEKEKIWAQYVEAFKKGVFNFVKEEQDAASGEMIPRKYFSGGMGLQLKTNGSYRTTTDRAELPKDLSKGDIIEFRGEPLDAAGKDTPPASSQHLLFKDGKLDPDGVVLVHAQNSFPHDGVLYPNNYYGDQPLLLRNPRTMVEFSFNGVINLWRDNDVVVLTPLLALNDVKPMNFWYTATSFLGPFRIPRGSTILVKEGAVKAEDVARVRQEGIGVEYFSSEGAVKAVERLLPKLGYQPMSLWAGYFEQTGFGTTWQDLDSIQNYADKNYQKGTTKQFIDVADRLGVKSVKGTEDYEFGYVTGLMEQSFNYFVTGVVTNDPSLFQHRKIAAFSSMAKLAFDALSSKEQGTVEARKFLAFADFYERLYALQKVVGVSSSGWADILNLKEKERSTSFWSERWEEPRERLIKGMNEQYSLGLGADALKTKKEYLDALAQIASISMRRYGLDDAQTVELKGSPVDMAEGLDGVRVVYDAMGEEDATAFSKFKYGSAQMTRQFGDGLLEKVRQEFGNDIEQAPDDWIVVSVGGSRFLGEYVAQGLGLHRAHLRIQGPGLLNVPYAKAGDVRTRLDLMSEKKFVLENSRGLKAKRVLLIDDLLNTGVTLSQSREFLKQSYGLDVAGTYVLFSIAGTKNVSWESELNTAFVDAQGIESLIRMVNGEEVFVTRHLLKQLFRGKDRIRNMLALAPDKRRQVLSMSFSYAFASTLTLISMKTSLVCQKIRQGPVEFTLKAVIKGQRTLSELYENILLSHLGSLFKDIEEDVTMPEGSETVLRSKEEGDPGIDMKDGPADMTANGDVTDEAQAAQPVFSNIDGFGATHDFVKHAFNEKEINELTGMGFTWDSVQREMRDDFRTNKLPIEITQEQYGLYKEDIKGVIAAKKASGVREMRVGLAGVGKSALEFVTVVRLFQEAFEESGISSDGSWQVRMVLIDSERDMLGEARMAKEQKKWLFEKLPFALTVHLVHEDFFDTRTMMELAAKEEYRGMDYMFNRNTVYGHDAAKYAIKDSVIKKYAENYKDPAWFFTRSAREPHLFNFLGVYLATKNILSVFCHKGTRYITEASNNGAALMIPGTRVLTEERGSGFYEVTDPDAMSREGVKSFLEHVEERADNTTVASDNAMRVFTDEERAQIDHTYSYLHQVATAVKKDIKVQGLEESVERFEQWLRDNIHKTDGELRQEPEKITEVLQVLKEIMGQLKHVAGIVRNLQEEGHGLVTFNEEGEMRVDATGIGENLLYDLRDQVDRLNQIFRSVFVWMNISEKNSFSSKRDIMRMAKEMQDRIGYSYRGYLEMIEDVLHPEHIKGDKLAMKRDYSRESNGLSESIYTRFLLPALPVIVPSGNDFQPIKDDKQVDEASQIILQAAPGDVKGLLLKGDIQFGANKFLFQMGRRTNPVTHKKQEVFFARVGHLMLLSEDVYQNLEDAFKEKWKENLIRVDNFNYLAYTSHTFTTMAALLSADLKGKRIIDAGAGQGLLSLVAAKLGASQMVLIEMDPDVLRSAKTNFELNGIKDVHYAEGEAADLNNTAQLKTFFQGLPSTDAETILVSNIGYWPEYSANNGTVIDLIPVIEEATGSRVNSFIAAGYSGKNEFSLPESEKHRKLIESKGFEFKAQNVVEGFEQKPVVWMEERKDKAQAARSYTYFLSQDMDLIELTDLRSRAAERLPELFGHKNEYRVTPPWWHGLYAEREMTGVILRDVVYDVMRNIAHAVDGEGKFQTAVLVMKEVKKDGVDGIEVRMNNDAPIQDIPWAVQRDHTTRDTPGIGLPFIIDLIVYCFGGEVLIESKEEGYRFASERKDWGNDPNAIAQRVPSTVKGTQISLFIPLQKSVDKAMDTDGIDRILHQAVFEEKGAKEADRIMNAWSRSKGSKHMDMARHYAKVLFSDQDKGTFVRLFMEGKKEEAREFLFSHDNYYAGYQREPQTAVYPGGLDLRIFDLFPNVTEAHFINTRPFDVPYDVPRLVFDLAYQNRTHLSGQEALDAMTSLFIFSAEYLRYISDGIQDVISGDPKTPQIGMMPFIKADLEYRQATDIHINRLPGEGFSVHEISFVDALGVARKIYYHQQDVREKKYHPVLGRLMERKELGLFFLKAFSDRVDIFPDALLGGFKQGAIFLADTAKGIVSSSGETIPWEDVFSAFGMSIDQEVPLVTGRDSPWDMIGYDPYAAGGSHSVSVYRLGQKPVRENGALNKKDLLIALKGINKDQKRVDKAMDSGISFDQMQNDQLTEDSVVLALSEDEIGKLEAQYPQYDWRNAARVLWPELVRDKDQKLGEQQNYFGNQVYVRRDLLFIIRDLLSGNLSDQDFVERMRTMHIDLLMKTGVYPIKGIKELEREPFALTIGGYLPGTGSLGRERLVELKGLMRTLLAPVMSEKTREDISADVGKFYSSLLQWPRLHVFVRGNHSWLMQIVNTMLRLYHFDQGLVHGHMDKKVPADRSIIIKQIVRSIKEANPDVDLNEKYNAVLLQKRAAVAAPGGIDLNSKNMPFNVRSTGSGVQFNFDPATAQHFQNAVGFTPVILDIHPMTTSLPAFLGLTDNSPALISS